MHKILKKLKFRIQTLPHNRVRDGGSLVVVVRQLWSIAAGNVADGGGGGWPVVVV